MIFSDIPNEFLVHPTKKDLVSKTDDLAVRQSIRNLVNLGIGGKPFHPEIAVGLDRILFEQVSPILIATVRRNLTSIIERFEPRAKVLNLEFAEEENGGALVITLIYQVVNTQKAQTIDFYFDRIR